MSAIRLRVLAAALAVTAMSGPVLAGPAYRLEYAQPYVEVPAAVVVFSRHSDRCDYPNGFNVTDFDKSINGTPRGGARLLAEGCATLDPFGP